MSNAAIDLNTENGMDVLAQQLFDAKAAEKEATAARIEAESALISAIGLKDEGSLSVIGTRFKVTTTQPITRKVLKAGIPEALRRLSPDIFDGLFQPEPKLNVKFFKELQQHQPDAYKAACIAVEAKKGKPSVKVEEI